MEGLTCLGLISKFMARLSDWMGLGVQNWEGEPWLDCPHWPSGSTSGHYVK